MPNNWCMTCHCPMVSPSINRCRQQSFQTDINVITPVDLIWFVHMSKWFKAGYRTKCVCHGCVTYRTNQNCFLFLIYLGVQILQLLIQKCSLGKFYRDKGHLAAYDCAILFVSPREEVIKWRLVMGLPHLRTLISGIGSNSMFNYEKWIWTCDRKSCKPCKRRVMWYTIQ